GWDEACHHTALEVLGYRFNRVPMLRAAARATLSRWAEDPAAAVATALEAGGGDWVRSGVRPANHPERRLRQYGDWVRSAPDWPARWARLAEALPGLAARGEGLESGPARRAGGLAAWRRRVGEEECGGALSGPRLDQMHCDGLLPLWAARSGDGRLEAVWRVWYPGDQPAELAGHLRRLGIIGGRDRPAAHGMFQGLIGWLLERSAGPVSSTRRCGT